MYNAYCALLGDDVNPNTVLCSCCLLTTCCCQYYLPLCMSSEQASKCVCGILDESNIALTHSTPKRSSPRRRSHTATNHTTSPSAQRAYHPPPARRVSGALAAAYPYLAACISMASWFLLRKRSSCFFSFRFTGVCPAFTCAPEIAPLRSEFLRRPSRPNGFGIAARRTGQTIHAFHLMVGRCYL